jgi:DNA-binding NarL/FixJ family response regulator
MRCVSVVIADRHPVVLCGVISLLRAESDFNVLTSCRDGTTCIQAIRDLSPDLALLDISMPGLSGLEILAATTSDHLCTRVVFLTASPERREIVTAIARGAYGVIHKEAAPQFLVQCLRRVASGVRLLPLAIWDADPRNVHECYARGALENLPSTLTERERQIMHLVSEGLSNKQVARQLNVCEGTIKVHLHHIYEKLAIRNRTALAALAVSHHDGMPLAI